MNILFISGELIAADLAYRLKKEGNEVKLFIENKEDRECFDGMVEKTYDWRSELDWVGKNGLIIFDDVKYGKEQDKLRKEGYLVIGGSGEGDKLELNRNYGQKVMKACGIEIDDGFETETFDVNSAIKFVNKKKGEWVLKVDDHNESLTYVGNKEDGSDIVCLLENYKDINGNSFSISLQKRVYGVELAVGRFFNGKDWIGPIVFNIEHKHFCNDDIGPLGGETGTIMWYDSDEKNKLFQNTLNKLKSHLQKSNYKGYIDINCIINKKIIYPLEFTCRFGSATNEMQSEIQRSPWSEFLLAMARGENYDLKYKKGCGVSVALTVSPFPYKTSDRSLSQKGIKIFFGKELFGNDFSHIHFEEVAKKENDGKEYYYIAGNTGYVLYITVCKDTVEEARMKIFDIINKIIIPKVFYRTDIGLRFVKNDRKLLKEWGWI